MSNSPHKTSGAGLSITVDAIPEDEERQEELNRTMRKPGARPYNPNAKWMDPPVPNPDGGAGDKDAPSNGDVETGPDASCGGPPNKAGSVVDHFSLIPQDRVGAPSLSNQSFDDQDHTIN